jgi:Tfp pilus assembly protein PilF
MCGSDVLGAEGGSKCTSCGANIEETMNAAGDAAPEGRAPAAAATPRELDDSKPIMTSGDLEVVQSGHAFWTENRNADQEDTDPTGSFARDAKPSTEAKTPASPAADSPEAEPKRSSIFTAESTTADAPSLAELARRRKAQFIQQGFADTTAGGEIRHDHVLNPSEVPTGEHDEPASPTGKATSTGGPNPDETQPSGIKNDPALAAQAALAGVSVVAKTPDIAYIDNNKLAIPGARWSTGDKVVISGRTYELRRKVARYPLSTREMLIGSGTFLGGIVIAWMIAAGGSAPRSSVYGVVRDAATGKLLPGVTVACEENNRTVQSDPSGLFLLDNLNGGIYTLLATDPIYGSTRKAVTISGDATSVTIDLERPRVAEVASTPPPSRQAARPSPPAATQTEDVSAEGKASELAVEASVANARVFIDGKLLGVGNARYSDLKPGRHQIEVTHEGFEPWKQNLTFAAGEVTRLNVDLKPVRDPDPVRVSADEYAAQGRKHIEARNWKLALEQFEAAIRQEQRPQFFAWRAEAFVGLKDLHHAEADFLQAVYLFRQSGQDSRLEGLLERAVLVVPASAPLWQARGEYLYSQRKLTDAEKCYRRALELGGDKAAVLTGIGLAQYAGGGFEAAFQSWTQADEASGSVDPHLAGYLALASARLQYRATCRDALRRLTAHQDVLTQFRAHPDWDKVQRLTGQG